MPKHPADSNESKFAEEPSPTKDRVLLVICGLNVRLLCLEYCVLVLSGNSILLHGTSS
jgi:hypothetical protein